jgi:hypothetical protein
MQSFMQVLSFLFLIVYTVASGIVGVKLLMRSRKSHGVPERLIGLAYVAAPALGYPLCVLAPTLPDRAIAAPLYVFGETSLVFGCCCYLFFTAKVFRPTDAWARWCAVVGSLVLVAAGVEITWSYLVSADAAENVARARIGLAPMVAVLGLYYVWTAFEGFRYYSMMKKRMALGLADAVVTNRFLLWAFAGLVSLAWNSVSAGCLVAGIDLRSTVPLLATSAGGFANTILLVLIFMPPAAYTRWVLRTARSGALAPA